MMIMMKVDVVRKEKEDNRVNNMLNRFFFWFNFPLHLFIVDGYNGKAGRREREKLHQKD